ncbi:MAG: DUF4340 domain-containing protein [Chloroflexi bacterium]|nr:DUF4340 domain-containing protein [Chloroflexota bacterium]
MLNRSNILLAATLVVQIVLLAISVAARTGRDDRAVQPLLPGFRAADVLELVIADDLDNSLRIMRSDDGWALPHADDFPVKSDKAEELLGSIAGLDTSRLVASNPANFPRLEVAEDGFRRKLSIAVGDEATVLYLGGSAGADTVYTRLEGENRAYLGAGLSAWEAPTQVSGWIDASYVSVPQEDLIRIKVSNAKGSLEFAPDGGTWRYLGLPEGESFEDTMMPSILRNASSVRMVEPLGRTLLDEYGLAEPAVTVEVEFRQVVEVEEESAEDASESGENEADDSEDTVSYTTESYTLSFGAQRDDGNIVLKSSTSDYYVTVLAYALDAFSDLSHADLVRMSEEETESAAEDAGG